MPSSATQEWLDKALEDETVFAIIRNNSGPYAIAAYHLQQAAEKYVKAALVEKGIAPPKTHDIVRLITLCSGSITSELDQAAGIVNAYAWATRYPGTPPITERDLVDLEREYVVLKNWALTQL